ncbi:MAG TPA: AAA family ATPase, partial [Polyangiaceae bacterium]|nr:AAA family ATPase [Polyangiaceae bacterium]
AARAAARELAVRHGVPFVLLECRVPLDVTRARLLGRAQGPSESDGRSQIFDDFAARFEPITELDPSEHVIVDTGGNLEQSLAQLRARGLL